MFIVASSKRQEQGNCKPKTIPKSTQSRNISDNYDSNEKYNVKFSMSTRLFCMKFWSIKTFLPSLMKKNSTPTCCDKVYVTEYIFIFVVYYLYIQGEHESCTVSLTIDFFQQIKQIFHLPFPRNGSSDINWVLSLKLVIKHVIFMILFAIMYFFLSLSDISVCRTGFLVLDKIYLGNMLADQRLCFVGDYRMALSKVLLYNIFFIFIHLVRKFHKRSSSY